MLSGFVVNAWLWINTHQLKITGPWRSCNIVSILILHIIQVSIKATKLISNMVSFENIILQTALQTLKVWHSIRRTHVAYYCSYTLSCYYSYVFLYISVHLLYARMKCCTLNVLFFFSCEVIHIITNIQILRCNSGRNICNRNDSFLNGLEGKRIRFFTPFRKCNNKTHTQKIRPNIPNETPRVTKGSREFFARPNTLRTSVWTDHVITNSLARTSLLLNTPNVANYVNVATHAKCSLLAPDKDDRALHC